MKAAILMCFLLLVTAGFAAAEELTPIQNSTIHKECKNNGYNYGISKWEFQETGKWKPVDVRHPFYNITVNGAAHVVYWKSNRLVAGVISQEGDAIYKNEGGYSEIIAGKNNHNIAHITFCGRYPNAPSPTPDPHGVPEFSPVTLAVAVVLSVLGIAAIRRH